MSWWHGGPKVHGGDRLLPPAITGTCRSGQDGTHDHDVFVTSERSLALSYASTCNGWIYEVEPVGELRQDPGSLLAPGVSMMCDEALILRRFKPSRQDMARAELLVRRAMKTLGAVS